ncbi:class I SAM-dependent methyltransferase [Granulosicoccus sp. 3-233]|uniref:class I SAM-dependent methyltransferase n=1 Tax=Granulosicoccus sp. 3-233 TaxID=3417969 RepID=UPI003D34A26C
MSIDHLRKDLVINTELAGQPLCFHTTWGLFSPRAIDEGSLLLLDHLEVLDDDVTLDMGCGYGPLGLSIAQRSPQGAVHLVDKDFLAVEYTQANARRNGLSNAQAYLSNGFSHVPEELKLSLVVSNLPAKVGNEFFQILFDDARRHMKPGARIVVVTINGLRDFIKRSFKENFGNYKKLKQGKSYTISMAVLED